MRASIENIIVIKLNPNEILDNAKELSGVIGADTVRAWIAQTAMADPTKAIPLRFDEEKGRAILSALNLIPTNKVIEVRGEEATYLVTLNVGKAVRCTCAQNVYHGTPCEHMQEAQAEHAMKKLARGARIEGLQA